MSIVTAFNLPSRLLRRVAADEQPPDSTQLALATGARPSSVDRALAHLAEGGLIEGLWTGERWTELRPTPRGRARAGCPYLPADHEPRTPSPLAVAVGRTHAQVEPIARTALAGAAGQLRSIRPALVRLRQDAAPRASALRLRAAETLRMFTSFP